MSDEQTQSNTLSEYIVEITDAKHTIHEGPLRDEISKELAQLFANKTDNETIVAFEDMALNTAIFAGIWSAIEHSSMAQKLNDCGYFYSVDAQAVNARDVAKFTDVASSLTANQKKISCLLVKMTSSDPTHASEYLSTLLKSAQLYSIRVVQTVIDYKEQIGDVL